MEINAKGRYRENEDLIPDCFVAGHMVCFLFRDEGVVPAQQERKKLRKGS
jgi:hypothetical protein